ncbi:MAG: LysR family transcriptional regulator [Megasphaera sp.]|jgi:DNA-binding transcriptional LysR family regulator|uniref:LysR family transcriptional regulator n=1 Tax=Megasphaera sueciensis TaxID=349094 RepID=UPI003D00350D|nr:LysR family transcriptional regulator [Megasphaera sp.]
MKNIKDIVVFHRFWKMVVRSLDNRDWQILAVLYKEKNITKTAQTLFISQPALTVRLHQMEDYFDVTIVNRNRKGVSFTTEGAYLAHSATKMLERIHEIKEQVSNLGTNMKGVLRIGASGYFTMFTMPRVLKQFKALYPDIDFDVVTTWSREIFRLMNHQDIHIGFASSDYGGSSERYILYEEPICIASMQQFRLQDIPSMPRIDYDTDLLIKMQIDKWWRTYFTKPPWITMRVDKLATCLEMIKANLGYGIVPYRILRDIDGIHVYNLQDKSGHGILRTTYLLYHPEVMNLRIASIFLDFVKQFPF